MAEGLRREAEVRKSKLKELNARAAALKGHRALGSQELALTVLNSDWEELQQKLSMKPDPKLGAGASVVRPSTLPASPRISASQSSPAGQISARIEKLRDELVSVECQLSASVLTGKIFENLSGQSEALDAIQAQLDKVRLAFKRIEQVKFAERCDNIEQLTVGKGSQE